jgi:serine/threonine protein kinase
MPVRLVSQEELPGPLKGYRLIERLGRGGFGEVWKVEAPGGLLKAVKFVFGDLDALNEDSRPAEQEAKALERVKGIRHPYILSLEQFRVIDGQLIIVMELADRNLWDRFRECRGQGLQGIPREELMRYMEETAEALDLMNNYYQIQHLDVKPQNLFLVFNHIKVADFGLAKVLEGVKATVTGGVTPVYAAPETFEGWVSRYSDQYSLGIVFQELLTGSRPFNGTNTRQLLMQHINGTPDLNSLPPADRAVIGRSLAKKPDDRWPSCTELVRALKQDGTPPPLSGARTIPAMPHAPQQSPRPGPQQPPRVVPGSGIPTMTSPGHALADSLQATRMAGGSESRVGTHNPAPRERTPPPITLPPLIKPNQGAGAPMASPPAPGSAPRLVTPGAAAANPAQTLTRGAVLQTGRMGSLGIAPPEKNGDGALFPALVVALGRTGRRVVEELKRAIADRYGSTERTPNVRILYIDTDPDAMSESQPALAPREVVLARLNRSTHYLQRDSLPPVEQWLPSGSLYKLPRNPGSASGVRAFGRLALCDHYRTIAQRVRQEIETFLTDDPLMQADKATGLGLRTNRPRAYVVAGLAGGTGSGMFLDVAYLVRHELRQVGYLRPEVVGCFFVPPADANSPRSPALGNTFAALAELHQFQAKKARYQAAFDKSEAPITDGEPPFARLSLLQLPRGTEDAKSRPVLATAARALYHEILTPTGRVADEGRDVYRKAFPTEAPACQTFGLFRLSWPRPEVLTAATHRLAQRQIQRWTGKEAAHLREPLAEWLAQQWAERKLSFEAVTESLNGAAAAALREEPERVFDAFIDPLRTRTPSGGRLDAESACAVLEQLVKLIGKPGLDDKAPGSLSRALNARFEELTKECEAHASMMAATFLEVPQYRLSGAEEAVRQIGEKLKRQVDVLEPLRDELDKDVRGIYARLIHAISALGASGLGASVNRKSNAAETLDLLRAYPRKRLQLHVLEMALSIFRKLLGNCPEFLREMNFCRATLNEMNAALAKSSQKASEPSGAGKMILPDGCKDLDAAADQFLAGLAPEDLLDFDQSLQKSITRKFRGLGSVCLKPVEKGAAFRELLLAKARDFLDTKLDHSNPATVFFRSRTQSGTAEMLLVEAFKDAAPGLISTGARPYEMTVLGAPPGDDGNRLLMLTREALPDLELTAAPLPDDICFYRELPQVPLTDLPQLAGHAREAYLLMGSDHPPHTRMDVPWQQPGS